MVDIREKLGHTTLYFDWMGLPFSNDILGCKGRVSNIVVDKNYCEFDNSIALEIFPMNFLSSR